MNASYFIDIIYKLFLSKNRRLFVLLAYKNFSRDLKVIGKGNNLVLFFNRKTRQVLELVSNIKFKINKEEV